jgi:hypothetical protein
MLRDLFNTGLTLTQCIGLSCLIYGVFLLIAATGGSGPMNYVKGAAVMAFGVYVVGLGQSL